MEAPEVVRAAAVHVWTTEAGVAGTVIDPYHVVVPLGVTAGGPYAVTPDPDVAAWHAFDLPEFDLMVMGLSRPAAPQATGILGNAECLSFWNQEVHLGRIENGFASFDWPQHVFDPIGAPLVVNTFLVGVIGPYDQDRRAWRVIPAIQLADTVQRRFFARFSRSAQRAVTRAFGMSDNDELHNEHLLVGLYENPDGSTRRLFDARGMTEETLRMNMSFICKSAQWREYVARPIVVLPELTPHAREAVCIAQRVAAEAGEPEIRSRHLLFGALSARCDVGGILHQSGISAEDVQLKDTHRNAGFSSDTAEGRDHLNVGREAAALANVLGSSRVEPPIAVGLLGNWGSGKSFFMKQLEAKLKLIEKRGDADSCSNIIQIWFNAWHYIDANLWASLTCEIFDKLDDELRRRDPEFQKRDPDSERAEYLAQSAKAQSERDAAAAQREEADKELSEIEQARQALADDEQVAARVGVLTLARQSPQVKTLADEAQREARAFAGKHGLDPKTIEELRGTWGVIRAVWMAMRRSGRKALALMLGLAIVTPLAVFLSQQLAILAGSMGTLGILATAVAAVRRYLPAARKAVGTVNHWLAEKDRLIAEERAKVLAALEKRTAEATETRAQAAKREEEAALRLRDSELKLLALQPAHQMKSFVRERRESTDYAGHLGIVAKAHDDFDRLSRYLENLKNLKGERVVDRIVLYIDDLDRCPESKVFDVLQAVHLLLAFKLFVVVVGVDSRWLLHSLRTQMKQFRALDDSDGVDAMDRALWESTPLNYLEKIFQIPFTLRPMPESGFDDLIEDLTRSEEEESVKPIIDLQALIPRITVAGAAEQLKAGTSFAISRRTVTPQQPEREPQPIVPITFTRNEIDWMKKLYTLMPSPRAVKRFVNLYRIIRGLLDEYRLERYLEGEYDAALLLLAMLTGFPEETTDVLQKLAGGPIASPWWTFISDFVSAKTSDPDVGDIARLRWTSLGAKLEAVRKEMPPSAGSRSCEHFAKWAPEIARFSFHSGRIASDYRGPAVVTQQAAPQLKIDDVSKEVTP